MSFGPLLRVPLTLHSHPCCVVPQKTSSRVKLSQLAALKLGLGLAFLAGIGFLVFSSYKPLSPINHTSVVEFKVPTINGATKHPLVFSGVPKSVVQVWAHPHNNDVNFDFWSAVGTFDANAQPNGGICLLRCPATRCVCTVPVRCPLMCCCSGGWGSNYFQLLSKLLTEPNSVYVSVGAWIGACALYAATLPAKPSIWAFEPDPAAFAEVTASD